MSGGLDSAAVPAVAELLRERERRAVRWNALGRAGLAVILVPLAAIVAGTSAERVALVGLCLSLLAIQVGLLRALHKGGRPERVGSVAVGLDALSLCVLPLMWHLIYTSAGQPLAHLLRHNFTTICFLFIAVNLLALRPRYPLVITATAVCLHVGLAVLAVTDPRLSVFPGGLSAAIGQVESVGDVLVVTPLLLLVAGAIAALATRAARDTVFEAIRLERAHRELRERQLQAVLEGRMAAVGELVAGVEHEVNNPLGALRSAADTATRSLARLRKLGREEPDETKVERATAALESSLDLTVRAGERLSEVMATIRGFVQLDASEIKRLKLAELVVNVLRLVQPALRPDTRLCSELDQSLYVLGDGFRLSQALTTVVQNAAEAFDAAGELRVDLRREGAHAVLAVQDSGRGMTAQQIANLFDIDFAGGSRVRARFGLPLCRSILHRHGGDIDVQSTPGQGTTVRFRLPLCPEPKPS